MPPVKSAPPSEGIPSFLERSQKNRIDLSFSRVCHSFRITLRFLQKRTDAAKTPHLFIKQDDYARNVLKLQNLFEKATK
jgi:hypothetical protein